MEISALALGSRGDVQPAVALSARLAERGHEVRLVAPLNFAKLAAGRSFDFVALPLDMTDELQSEFDILFSARLQPLALIRWSIKFWRKRLVGRDLRGRERMQVRGRRERIGHPSDGPPIVDVVTDAWSAAISGTGNGCRFGFGANGFAIRFGRSMRSSTRWGTTIEEARA